MIINGTESVSKSWLNQIYWSSNANMPAASYSTDVGNLENEWDTTFVIPILATVMLALTVFLLILFRHSPAFVAGTIAGCLILIGTYLAFSGINENVSNFE